MAKRNRNTTTSQTPAQAVWARAVTAISENGKQGGLEIRFDAEPSPRLQPKLRAMNFRHSRVKTMWYGENTTQSREFAEQLKVVLPEDPDGPDLYLFPSAEAVRANLEKKEFSFVMISLADGSVRSYVIFEPSKPKAEVIASEFAREKFKDRFVSVAVFPRARIKEARLLFESDLVIYPDRDTMPLKEADTPVTKDASEPLQIPQTTDLKPTGVLTDKIPMKLIELGEKEGLVYPDYDRGVHFTTFAETDIHVKTKLIGWLSDVYFRITWQDDEVLEGSIDLEPPSFYEDKPAPFSWFVRHYFTYLSKQEPSVLNSRKRIDHARLMLAHYWLEDRPAPVADDTSSTPPTVESFRTSADDQRDLERMALEKFYKWAVLQKDESMKPSNLTREAMTAWFKENRPELDEVTVTSIWWSHVRITKATNRLLKRSSGKPGSQPYSSIYKKLHRIIPGLIEHLKAGKWHGKSRMDPDGGLMDLNLDFDGYDKDGNPTIALSHYFIQKGDPIADPDMKIRLLPDMEMAEAMALQDQFGYKVVYEERDGKTYVNLREKKDQNKFLSYWLSNLIQQGHKIDLEAETPESQAENQSTAPTEILPDENVLALLSQFIPGLRQPSNITRRFESVYTTDNTQQVILASVSPDGVDAFNIYFDDTVDQHIQLQADVSLSLSEPRIAVTSLWFSSDYTDQYGGTIRDTTRLLQFTRWLSDHVKKRRTMTRVIDDTMLLNKESREENLGTKADNEPFDEFAMAQLIALDEYLGRVWSVKFKKDVLTKSSFQADEREYLLAMYNIYVVQDWHMQDAYNTVYRDRHGIQQPERESEPTKTISHSRAADLVFRDHQLPNVLVPTGTREPFLSHSWGDDIEMLLKSEFPHLLKLKENDLPAATPIEMFELIQFGHPTEFGIDVSRADLLEEWEKRGKEVFEDIGYPTDPDYPYANLHTGYRHVESLDALLNSYNSHRGNKWWSVAENARPIAEISKALSIIDQLIAQREAERASYLNPKTGKPKQDKREQTGDVDFIIRRLKKSREVVVKYQDILADGKESKEQRNANDPLATADGVYTRNSAGDNMETIRIDMPKTSGYTATVYLVKTSAGDYREGIAFAKSFGDYSSQSSLITVQDERYPTREAALKAALLLHERELQTLLRAEDAILNNETTKKSKLNQALNALYQFAKEQGISLETAPDVLDASEEIIQGLEDAYWKDDDNRYPQNKAVVRGAAFDQARLRDAIRTKLKTLSLATLQEITYDLSARFTVRRTLDSYEKSLVTVGKTGDKRKKVLIAHYVDDVIVDNDLQDKTTFPVMTYLIELLFSGAARLADIPQTPNSRETTKKKPEKKQSQHELNQEIEALIDAKDKEGASYNEEEKNHLRQYTGSGGLLSEGASGRGTLYEFYTPDLLVRKMWDMAYHYGYDGGRILEPSVGTGNFLKYAPKTAIVSGFETNHYAARIAQVLYPHAHIHEKAFETHFFAGNIHLKDAFENPGYSLVIGNPPYGAFSGKYAGLGEKRYTGVTEYDQYFTLRGLDLMKGGGLMVFLVPSYFMLSTEKYNKTKEKITAKAELIDCYRLPGGAIPHTDIGTDILVWRKRL